jgi:hypothetical protein
MAKQRSAFRKEQSDSNEWLHLSDLISGLNSNLISADDLIDRIDPDLADELHAITAHRGLEMSAFLAEALTQVAFDAADSAWRNALTQCADFDEDPEAVLLEKVLRIATQVIRHSMMIASDQPIKEGELSFQRVGQPYKPV